AFHEQVSALSPMIKDERSVIHLSSKISAEAWTSPQSYLDCTTITSGYDFRKAHWLGQPCGRVTPRPNNSLACHHRSKTKLDGQAGASRLGTKSSIVENHK